MNSLLQRTVRIMSVNILLAGTSLLLLPQTATAGEGSFSLYNPNKSAYGTLHWWRNSAGLKIFLVVADAKCDGNKATARLDVHPGANPFYWKIKTLENKRGCHTIVSATYQWSVSQLGDGGRDGVIYLKVCGGRNSIWQSKCALTSRWYD